MVKIGEYLCGFLMVLLMAPVLLVGFFVALFDLRHYVHVRHM
jgi:hypothetical protein